MIFPRYKHILLLCNGFIYCIGGQTKADKILKECERYFTFF